MPPECPPNSAVTIQQVDERTWIVRKTVAEKGVKMLLIPLIEDLPDDAEQDKREGALARAGARNLPPPEE